jgi:ribosomal-protein-alanine acetyltransferase
MSKARTDSVLVRRGLPADLDALEALERASFATDRLSRRQLRHHLVAPSSELLVAVEDQTLLGYALVFHSRRYRIARLYSIAVAAHARGRGVGLALMKALMAAARQRGALRLRLEVRQDNRAAIALYEQLGFVRFGARRAYYGDGADAWRYELTCPVE